MPQFKVIKKAYGSKAPGEPQELLAIGDIVTADKSPGSAYQALDGEVAKAASPAAVTSAKKRAAAAAQDKD